MLKTVELYNEKGNVKVAVRNAIKEATMPVISEALATIGRDVTLGTDGAFYVPVATDENGATIYARAELTISLKDPNADVPARAVKTAKEPVVLPELF